MTMEDEGADDPAAREPIAIIGMSCRFAPDLDSLARYWTFLVEERSAVAEIPADRWAIYEAADPRAAAALRNATRHGSFLDRIADFDPDFFGMSAREAASTDPQQRMILELAWEALEHGGIRPSALKGSDAGVFAAASSLDYGMRMFADLAHMEPWTLNGGMLFGIANRVSYLLDLHGPSLVVDTACAASLTALHLACQSLRNGETGLAIVAAVNLMSFPGMSIALDASGATAPDGRCKSFDVAANGYGRGEGAGVLILKRQRDAVRDHDRILALVRGSGVFQDGRTAGMMAPNGDAQERMLRQIYQRAGVAPESVQYVEAHGTGTRLGDQAELAALASVFGAARGTRAPCLVGSVKPNIGHLEAAAGIAGLIKVVLSIRHGALPPSLHASLTTEIDWPTAGIEVVSRRTPWPSSSPVGRRAGVSCFGVGGTIAHAIIEDAPAPAARAARPDAPSGARIFPLSGRGPENVSGAAARLADWLDEHPDVALDDVGHTLGERRDHLAVRAAVSAATRVELIDALRAAAAEPTSRQPAIDAERTGTVFVFSGHGAQWNGMCRELLETEPVFAAELDALADVFREELGYTPRDAIRHGEFGATERIQAMTFASQVALAALWISKGIEPCAVIGYSTGEIAAAVVAGALDKQEAARFACRRARLYQRLAGQGGMVFVNLPFAEAGERLATETNVVAAIAASPLSSVISGDAQDVARLAAAWRGEGRVTRRVASDVAFHSPHVDRIIEDIRVASGTLRVQPPRLPMYNSTLGDPRAAVARDAAFWAANSRNPVRFEQAVHAALEDGFRFYLEVSTKPIVSHGLRETADTLGHEAVAICPTLRERQPERRQMLNSLAQLYCQGANVVWSRQFPSGQLADLPPTRWHHRTYWTQARPMHADGGKGHDPRRHTLLGARRVIHGAPVSEVWRTRLDVASRPYPGRHPICGVEILPAAVLLHSFMQAGADEARPPALVNVDLRTPVAVEGVRDIQVVRQGAAISLASRLDEDDVRDDRETEPGWVMHTTATLSWTDGRDDTAPDSTEWLTRCPQHPQWADIALRYQHRGVAGYGFAWRVVALQRGATELVATIESEVTDSQPGSWAVVFDAALTLIPVLLPDDDVLRMPEHIERVSVEAAPPARFTVLARVASREGDPDRRVTDVWVLDERHAVVARITGLVFGDVDPQPDSGVQDGPTVFVEAWEDDTFEGGELDSLPYLILLADEDTLASRLSNGLRRIGVRHARCRRIEDIDFTGQDTIALVIGGAARDDAALDVEVEHQAWRLLSAAQAVVGLAERASSLRLGCVTFGVREPRTRATLAQSALWGMARIIAGEHPERWAGLIDVAPDDLHDDGMLLRFVHALARGAEDVIAIDRRRSEVLRLIPAPAPAHRPAATTTCDPGATYVVTGGFGALGLHAAQYLVDQGARRLILIGRRGVPPRRDWSAIDDPGLREALDGILALERQGVTVVPLALDIADEQAVTRVLEASSLGMPPVRGIVHAAGAFRGGLLENLDRAALHDTLRAKVSGTLALARRFPPDTLDFFVLFSSCGQVARLAGQACYAAANAFLDGFARHHAGRVLSIGWMSWARLGMSRNIDTTLQEAQAHGLDAISVPTALASWRIAQDSGAPYAAVFRARYPDILDRPLPVLSRVAEVHATDAGEAEPAEPWRDIPEADRPAWFVDDVKKLVAAELHCAPAELDPKRSLIEKGLDSLLTVALRIRLKQRYAIDVPPTLIWNHPTIEAVARYVRNACE